MCAIVCVCVCDLKIHFVHRNEWGKQNKPKTQDLYVLQELRSWFKRQ